MKRILEDIKKKTWYKQGGAILPFFCFEPYVCMYEEIGHDNVYVIQNGMHNVAYFEKLKEKEHADMYLKKYLDDAGFLKKRIEEWKKIVKKQQEMLKEITELEFTEDEKLRKLAKEYFKQTVKAWHITMVIEVFDPWGEHFIEEYSAKYNLTDDEVAVLTAPNKLGFMQREMIDRLKDNAKEHYTKYHWYLTSWQHATITDVKHFEKLMKEDIRKEAEEIKKNHAGIKSKKESIIKMYDIDDETQNVFRFFSELNDWRDVRKEEGVCKVNYMLWHMLVKIAKHNKISNELMGFGALHELESFKLPGKYVEILKKRSKQRYVMYFNEKDEEDFIYGNDADKVFNALEEKIKAGAKVIKGRVAFKGKVKGKVKIVNSIKEFSKMKQGDILVSIMTRPEMVPVMKKAAAIITDEGGMTCHAAIVARELKIPCIVGTQVATSSLKDRQEVEVDAEKGVVKIFK